MACRIERNPNNGKINKVVDGTGLFQQIFNIPSLSLKESIDVFKNTFSDKLKDKVHFQIIGKPIPTQQKTASQITQELIDRLKQNGLSEDVFLMSTEEINAKLEELGVSEDVRKQVADYIRGYYSNANTAFSNLKDKNVKNVQGWMKALTDVQKNGGIKNVNQELEWIGLEDYLNDYVKENNPKAGNIPSSVVEDYIKSNQIEIVDVSKVDNNYEKRKQREFLEEQQSIALENEDYESADFYERRIERLEDTADTSEVQTKYSGYQLKGGENYREVLLTMPGGNTLLNKLDKELKAEGYVMASDAVYPKTIAGYADVNNYPQGVEIKDLPPVARSIAERMDRERGKDEYKSSHWDEKNIIAHVRLNEKTLPDGRKVLIVNEIQSDWAQEGRKTGWKDNEKEIEREQLRLKVQEKKDEVRKIEEQLSNLKPLTEEEKSELNKEILKLEEVRKNVRNNKDWDTLGQEIVEIEEKLESYENNKNLLKNNIYELKYIGDDSLSILEERLYNFDKVNQKFLGGVAAMPYTNTDQWVGLVTRRVMQMASQEGYDGIAFATGQQSSDMYSLSQQVDKINIGVFRNKKTAEIFLKNGIEDMLFIDDEGIIVDSVTPSYKGKKAEDVLGKDLTKKILETTEDTTLEGEGLEFGGEGMKTFYDKIVPKVVQKEAQRFDKNAKLETVHLSDNFAFSKKELDDYTNYLLNKYNLDKTGRHRILIEKNATTEEVAKYKNLLENFRKDNDSKTFKGGKLSLGVQPYLPLTQAIKDSVSQGIPQFQKALNKVGIDMIVNGFVYKNQVFLNKDVASNETAMHEFNHLFNSWLKENRKELYNKGINLVKAELEKENSDISEIISYVKTTQPDLKGEAFLEELLTELTGRRGSELLNSKKKSGIIDWLKEFWNEIKDMLGLLEATPEQVSKMTLKEFADASAVQLLKGLNITDTSSTSKKFLSNRSLSNFETLLKEGTWGMLTAENPNAQQLSEEENIIKNKEAEKWLKEKGYSFISIEGMYEQKENSFLVPELTFEDAVEFANYFSQESVATNEGLVYQDGTFNPRKQGEDNVGGEYDNYFSEIILEDKPVKFQVNYDFDKKEKKIPNISYENSSNYANLTEDSEGNFVFFHRGGKGYKTIKRNSGVGTKTSSQEAGALSKVGGVAMYYTRPEDSETKVPYQETYVVKVPKDKVYDFNSDPLNLLEEAKKRHSEEYPNKAFDANTQMAYITKIASEKGFKMVVGQWEGRTRAQSYDELTPVDSQVLEGNKIEKDFKETFVSNTKKGWVSVIPLSKEDKLKEVYLEIYKERNSESKYDSLYRLYEESSKKTQDEITDLINNSDISEELKNKYNNILLSEEEIRESKLEVKLITFNGYNTLEEAVKNTPKGENISINLSETKIGSIKNEGDILDLVAQDILGTNRELNPNGDVIYITKGNSTEKKLINAQITKDTVGGYITPSGNISIVEKEETEVSDNFEKNKKEVGTKDALTLVAADIIEKNTPAFGNGKIINEEIEVPEDNVLMTKLKNLLQELGIKTMSLENWEKAYEKRTGEKPSPNALADISEKIIAFANGEVTQDALTEEVMHFIIEALDQTELQPLLDMVHKTDEWREYSKTYSDIYQDENQVRREILAKVLKNYVQQRAQQSTLQGQSVVNRLVSMFERLVNNIKNLFTDSQRNQLDKFKEDIYNKLMAEELFNELSPEQYEGNKLIMYQAQTNDPLASKIEKLLDSTYKVDRKTGSTSQLNLDTINVEKTDELSQLHAVTSIASVVRKHTNWLVNRGKKEGFLSTEETYVFRETETTLRTLLNDIKGRLREDKFKYFENERQLAIKSAEDAISAIDVLSEELTKEKEEKIEDLIDETARELGLSETNKNILRKEINTLQRDTNQFYALFGGLVNAQNPILNMLARRIGKMHKETTVLFSKEQNDFLNKMNELGFKDEEIAKMLNKFKRGYYLFSTYDWEAYDKARAEIKAEVYNKYSEEKVTYEDILKREEELKQKLSREALSDYSTEVYENIKKSGINVTPLKEEEQKNIDEITNGFSIKTKKLLNQIASRKRVIYQNALRDGGLSEEDNRQLQEISAEQLMLSNLYDNQGNLKEGVQVDENDLVVELPESEINNLSEDVRTSYELAVYQKRRMEYFTGKESKAPINFIEQLNSLPTEEREKFLRNNARFSFNNKFWDTFDKSNSLVSRLNETEEDTAIELANQIEKLNRKLRNILKQNRKFNTPSQINFNDMSGNEILEVKEIVSSLNDYYRQAKTFLPESEVEAIEKVYETVVNDDYKSQLSDRGITNEDLRNNSGNSFRFSTIFDKRMSFIFQHMTSENRRNVERNESLYRAYKEGKIDKLPKAFENFDSDSQTIEQNIIDYAETKLLPYFMEIKPEGFDINRLMADLMATTNANEWDDAVSKYDFMSVQPAYIWLDAETNERLNPEYSKRIETKEPLINLDRFVNKEYLEYFGMSSVEATPTKNLKEFEALKELVAFQEKSLQYAGMEGKHNKYLLPQFRRGSFARAKQLATDFSWSTFKESIKDIVETRETETDFGQDEEGNDLQVIQKADLTVPRQGFNRLETESEVTDELLYSYMTMMHTSIKRNRRVDALTDVEALRTAVQNKQYGDKTGESTSTYQMLDDFVRYNIYGQKETFKAEVNLFGKKQNVAPLIRGFQNWVRLVNLGFSILTPMTSLFQGSTNFLVENFVGDRINKDASKLASRKMPKLMSQAVSEHFNVRAKSELNILLQFMGAESPLERFENSNYGKAARGMALSKSAYFSHFMGDVPLTAQTLLTVMHDFRLVGNELISYNEWRRKNRSLSEKEARLEWKKYDDNVLYNLLEVKEGETVLKEELNQVENLNDRLQFVRNKYSIAKQEIDNQISVEDKGRIQRHAIFSFASLHKGWLISSLTKRLKSRHLNQYSGIMEEGTYVGTVNFLMDSIKDIKSKGFKEAWKGQFKDYTAGYKKVVDVKNNKFLIKDKEGNVVQKYENQQDLDKAFEELKEEHTNMRQISVKRALADFVVTNALVAIALLFKSMADDDDDDYTKEFMAYAMYRLSTEVTSQSTGIPAQAYNFLESPTVGLSQIQNMLDIADLANDEQITRGNYRGLSKQQAWIFKSLPMFKEYYKVTNIDRTRNSFEFFNKKNLKFTVAGQMMME